MSLPINKAKIKNVQVSSMNMRIQDVQKEKCTKPIDYKSTDMHESTKCSKKRQTVNNYISHSNGQTELNENS